mmetsp:Transcript_3616/g.5631  ORF Transcript_3616/g.5631 Transcript_3616/m.5631 type:complete len:766 (+) Transcript_3616:272-2569(+)|eukprot:CAMPEP_0178912814 /NCGR_PEP_ID=MMETSP0786-20121207/10481_1 /TAXON_ID=186022 /ORGANISM="Thalassionema frauenfeldii, Strain CCMP 1798" /LENGTH=765 /DNA_ID=CAMNT_0020585457 /DNA_START=234 /DNA_END=2531 /DNA_ORIENTATION=+
MNGGFGGAAAFDFGDNYGFCANNDQQEQRTSQQQQRFLQNPSHFDGYDPTIGASAALLGLPYNTQYAPTSTPSHATFLPSAVGVGADTFLQFQQQQQQQQQHNSYTHQASVNTNYGFNPAFEPIQSIDKQPIKSLQKMSFEKNSLSFAAEILPDLNNSAAKTAEPARKANPDLWLDDMKIKCPDVSLEPLSGNDVLKRVRSKTDDVVTRYLPCVEFLVMCQQELRAGLAAATQKRLIRHSYRDSMTPRQFYDEYLGPLPDRFYQRNKNLMEMNVVKTSVTEIRKLCDESKRMEYQGCEVMKNTFLGGMKDGESWGLRKWLSKHGGALHICNDLECILRSCQDLDRSLETTRKLGERLRPLADQALERLRNDVPASYQEVSTAHPYLPFFHRLESALKGMANFDPEDDDVICIDDDDEIAEVKQIAKDKEEKQEKRKKTSSQPSRKKLKLSKNDSLADFKLAATGHSNESDEDSIIEVVDVKPAIDDNTTTNFEPQNDDWECYKCTMLNDVSCRKCCMCGTTVEMQRAESDYESRFKDLADEIDDLTGWDPALSSLPRNTDSPTTGDQSAVENMNAEDMANEIEKIAHAAERNELISIRPKGAAFDGFWDIGAPFASALRLLVSSLRNKDASSFVDPIDDTYMLMMGKSAFSSIIKHPICKRDIVAALIGDGNGGGDGRLPIKGLCNWNMWRGLDLLQAMDLVFLNNLAYNGKEKSKERSTTNKLRRLLWDGINEVIADHFGSDVDQRRRCMPTRRGETSGFVIRK